MERRDFLDTVDTDDSLLASPDCLLVLGKLDVDMLEGFLDMVDTRDIFLSPWTGQWLSSLFYQII